MNSKWNTTLAILAALGLVAPDTAVAREVELATLGCLLAPSEKVEVSSPVPGILEEVAVRRGNRVIRGAVLFRLRAGVEKASVELARVKVDFAQRKFERNQVLYADEILTEHERDEIETELLMAQKELTLREQELALRNIFSPVDGVVVNRLHNEGEYVNVDPVLELATLNPLHVDLLLPSKYFGQIKVGQSVKVRPADLKIDARVATVSIVDPLIDPASGTFRAQLVLANPQNRIPAGIRCTTRLIK